LTPVATGLGGRESCPIIEQAMIRVSYQDAVDTLIRHGRDLEKIVLARACGISHEPTRA